MADSKDKSNTSEVEATPELEVAPSVAEEVQEASTTPVADVDQGSPLELEAAVGNPNEQQQAEVDKPVGPGENLYFFPDLQKSVVATSLEAAQQQVQGELDTLKNEGNN